MLANSAPPAVRGPDVGTVGAARRPAAGRSFWARSAPVWQPLHRCISTAQRLASAAPAPATGRRNAARTGNRTVPRGWRARASLRPHKDSPAAAWWVRHERAAIGGSAPCGAGPSASELHRAVATWRRDSALNSWRTSSKYCRRAWVSMTALSSPARRTEPCLFLFSGVRPAGAARSRQG